MRSKKKETSSPKKARSHGKQVKLPPIAVFAYWMISMLIWEGTLHAVAYDGLFGQYAFYILGFSFVTALIFTVLTRLFNKTINKIILVALSAVMFVFYASQLVYYKVFGSYYSFSSIQLGGGAITNFWRETLSCIRANILTLLLLALPLIAAIFFTKRSPKTFKNRKFWKTLFLGGSAGVVFLLILLVMRMGGTGYYTVYDFYHSSSTQTEQSVNCFGAATTLRLEFQSMMFGSEENDPHIDPVVDPVDPEPEIDTSPNWVYNLDTAALETAAANISSKSIRNDTIALNEYLATAKGTNKNEYTGMFEGYNLIMICAESYSPALINDNTKDMFPALYKLTHEGIIFTNYYTSFPNVTTNAEYSLNMGMFPDMSRSKWDSSFMKSEKNYLPYCPGNMFKSLNANYTTFGFHNYKGSYFERTQTHANMGYDMYFMGSDYTGGRGMKFSSNWINSDLEMVDQAWEVIKTGGEPFMSYFMTFSGHYQYTFGKDEGGNPLNPMCYKHRTEVENLPYSKTVRAYIACNLELELALEKLLDNLAAAGMSERTVIVLTGDHYPYGLTEKEYAELLGRDLTDHFDKYHNSFVCWNGGMVEPIVCDNYCCNIDILPTVYNLMGIPYDSRLMVGTDVLSNGTHMAILTDESFITNTMMLDTTKSKNNVTFFVDENNIPNGYVDYMVSLVKNKMSISSKILNADYYRFIDETLPKLLPDT